AGRVELGRRRRRRRRGRLRLGGTRGLRSRVGSGRPVSAGTWGCRTRNGRVVGCVGRRLGRAVLGHLRRMGGTGGAVVVRVLVNRGAATRERRGGCGHRRDLLAGGQLGGGVEAIA